MTCRQWWLDPKTLFLPPELDICPIFQLCVCDAFPPVVSNLVAHHLLEDEESIAEVFVGDGLLGKMAVYETCLNPSNKGFKTLMWLSGCC